MNSSSSTSLFLSGGSMGQGRDFAHMAARIQDRANILTSETSDLHKEEADLEQLKCVLRDEQREFQCIRREALVAQQERDTSEMEHLQAVKELEEYEDSMVSIQCQTEEFQSKMKNDLQYWEETLANKCESHRTEMNLYTKYLEGKIMAVEEASTRRRQQISILRTKAENFAKETEAVTEQQTQVRFEAERAVDRQEKHNTEMQELVSQVHASVNKRRELRVALSALQEKYEEINKKFVSIEQEYLSLGNRGQH